jgi:hypothetical protein
MPRRGPDLRKSRHNPNNPDIYGPPEHTITEPGQHSFDRGTLSDPNPIPPPVSLDIAGKIGQTVFQHTIPWISNTEHGTEKMLQRRRHVMPFDPRTHLQLLCRCRFAAAVAGWHLLTTDEKREYNRQGNARFNRIEGLNVWIRQFVREHELNEYQLEATLRLAQATIPFQPYPLIGLALAAPLLGDTMTVTQVIGPPDDILNIPAGGILLNDPAITATKAGHTIIAARVLFTGPANNETVTLAIWKNFAILPGPLSRILAHIINQNMPLITFYAITDAAIGDLFRIWISASATTADILAGNAMIITATA